MKAPGLRLDGSVRVIEHHFDRTLRGAGTFQVLGDDLSWYPGHASPQANETAHITYWISDEHALPIGRDSIAQIMVLYSNLSSRQRKWKRSRGLSFHRFFNVALEAAW